MWLYDGIYIAENSSWVAGVIRHPPNWAIWADADKEAAGLTQAADPEQPSDVFYSGISRNEDGSWAATERDLAGLKTDYTAATKRTAADKLSLSDWQVIAKTERDREIDEATATYRAAVLSSCSTIEGRIGACNTMDDFKALFVVPDEGNASINDWPSAQ
jgi:hypothetical protein